MWRFRFLSVNKPISLGIIVPLSLVTTFSSNHWVGASTNFSYTISESPHRVSILLAQTNNLEQEIIVELNRVRANPSAYAAELQTFRPYYEGNLLKIPGSIPIQTVEGVKAVDEAVQFLRSISPMPSLSRSAGMSRSAREQVNDQGPKGTIGHNSSDGSDPFSRIARYGTAQGRQAETISYSESTAQGVVRQLIVDDGVPSRGHRQIILNPQLGAVGVACGYHARYGTMCVMDYATAYIERG
jgi:uncharacterized protein YkwD